MTREPGLYWLHQVTWMPAYWDGKRWSVIGSSRTFTYDELLSSNVTIGEKVERNTWIPVGERLPDPDELVKVIDNTTGYMSYALRYLLPDGEWTWCVPDTAFIKHNGDHWEGDCESEDYNFTHWMPITETVPEPPKQ